MVSFKKITVPLGCIYLLILIKWLHLSKNSNLGSLNIHKIRHLLNDRGIIYSNEHDKLDLIKFLEDSGDLTEDSPYDRTGKTAANFPGENSNLEDAIQEMGKFVWLIKVHHGGKFDKILEKKWQEFINLNLSWPIKHGVYHCRKNNDMCRKKLWISSKIILILPPVSNHSKRHVFLSYSALFDLSIKDWMIRELSSNKELSVISDKMTLKSFADDKSPKILFALPFKHPPKYLHFLQMKYSHEIKFGYLNTTEWVAKKYLGSRRSQMRVYRNKSEYEYSRIIGEELSFNSLDYYLKTSVGSFGDITVAILIIFHLETILRILTFNGLSSIKDTIKWWENVVKVKTVKADYTNCLSYILGIRSKRLYGIVDIGYLELKRQRERLEEIERENLERERILQNILNVIAQFIPDFEFGVGEYDPKKTRDTDLSKKLTIVVPNKEQEGNTCFCGEQPKKGEFLQLNCKHIYHSKCIQDWYAYQNSCRLCREIIIRDEHLHEI
ncbi:DgyrCDS11817 [Dimorphilus gyrociliatus]|uniref:DgyrCDS11817 n=1 Tax=Dimorphilus gyrociliatus TaxID=2664684 RepID=A0A7I8W5N4_9ANNE|nr:DgyrCDS11817 [Dimorphilus gyrociliatus]